jgi:hypothetical protein
MDTKASPHDEVKNVLEWFEAMHSANLPVRGTVIREKATRVAVLLGIDNFNLYYSIPVLRGCWSGFNSRVNR